MFEDKTINSIRWWLPGLIRTINSIWRSKRKYLNMLRNKEVEKCSKPCTLPNTIPFNNRIQPSNEHLLKALTNQTSLNKFLTTHSDQPTDPLTAVPAITHRRSMEENIRHMYKVNLWFADHAPFYCLCTVMGQYGGVGGWWGHVSLDLNQKVLCEFF